MPTGPDRPSPEPAGAEGAARSEARRWMAVAAGWRDGSHPDLHGDVKALEREVVVFHDPAADLARRAERWHYPLRGMDLADLARFAAGLAGAEAEAWEADLPDLAARAFSDRRFLMGDRILPWAVPWLDTVGRCYPNLREEAHGARDVLLRIGDLHRPAPDLGIGGEGLHPPGEDGYGLLAVQGDTAGWLASLWSGGVLLRATVRSVTGSAGERILTAGDLADPGLRADLATLYSNLAARWRGLAGHHAGSAGLWLDLAARAERTAGLLDG